MKKMKVLLVGMLTLVMSLLCFSSCFLHYGKYTAVEHRMGNSETAVVNTLKDSKIYVELKGDNVAVYASQNLIGNQEIKEGTWEKGEEFGQYTMKIDTLLGTLEYAIVIEGATMKLSGGDIIGTYILKR